MNKKIYLSVLVILLLVIVKSAFAQQEFAPIGAKWYYNRPNTFATNNFIVFESVKDTVIDQKTCKIVEIRNDYGTSETVHRDYFYQDLSKIYYFNHKSRTFHLLYDFSASPGDTITVHAEAFTPNISFLPNSRTIPFFKYVVVEVENIEVSGINYVRQKVKDVENSTWGFVRPLSIDQVNYILSDIGSLVYMYGASYIFVMEDEPIMLRCYETSGSLYANPLWTGQCTEGLSTPIKNINTINVYPNPFENDIYVESDQEIVRIEVYSIIGNLVFSSNKLNVTKEKLSLNNLPKGSYILRIITKDNNYYKKIQK